MAEPLLNEAELTKIAAAVEAAERGTSGEIVPVVLARSDGYPGARWRMAVILAALAAFAAYWLRPELDPIWYLWIELPGLALGYALGSVPWIQRNFLASAEMDEEVKQRAFELFSLHRVHETRDRSGVLILVSLLEHRVEVVADEGINAKVAPGSWDHVVDGLIARIRAGALADGLCAAVAETGTLLMRHFPARPDDRNELSNRPRLDG